MECNRFSKESTKANKTRHDGKELGAVPDQVTVVTVTQSQVTMIMFTFKWETMMCN